MYNYTSVAILSTCSFAVNLKCNPVEEPLLKALQEWDVRIVQNTKLFVTFDMPYENGGLFKVATFFQETYLKTRVYIFYGAGITGGNSEIHFMLDTMERMGLLQTGEYFVIGIIFPGSQTFYINTASDAVNFLTLNLGTASFSGNYYYSYRLRHPKKTTMHNAYRSSAIIMQMPYDDIVWNAFVDRLLTIWKNPRCPPLCRSQYPLNNPPSSKIDVSLLYPHAGRLYDAMMLYVDVILEVIAKNSTPLTQGSDILSYFTDRHYKSIFGGERYIDLFAKVYQLPVLLSGLTHDGFSAVWPLGTFKIRSTSRGIYDYDLKFNDGYKTFNWLYGKQPAGQPKCGFNGEKCTFLKDYTGQFIGLSVGISSIFVFAITILIHRQWKYEIQLKSLVWKILTTDLVLQDIHHRSFANIKNFGINAMSAMNSTTSLRMRRSSASLRDFEQGTSRQLEIEQGSPAKENIPNKGNKNEPETVGQMDKWLNMGPFEVALHKGKLVALKKIYKKSVDFNRVVQKEIKLMRDLFHENLNPFVGAVHEPPLVFLVSEYCPRGDLRDILENDDIKLDDMFICSIVFGIIRGLTFIHTSKFICHGNMKSTNCFVDARWVIKLSGFGFVAFKNGEQEEFTEEQVCRNNLWTAPEILRREFNDTHSLQKGDIYSLGIILHEIYGRNGPFGDEIIDSIDAIRKVKFQNAEQNLFRPSLKDVEQAPEFVRITMQKCWLESPQERPTISDVKKLLQPLRISLKANISDNTAQLMENYTGKLEGLVAERTNQLEEEKRKSEKLLLIALPKFIANQLRLGQRVEAELFETSTICFSNIADFTKIASESLPYEVVNFFNDLNRCFDAIIAQYDVCKAETLGGAIMHVSGLPVKNGRNHAGEIASMSLNLLEAAKTFKIRHKPNNAVLLRIGLHTGMCTAGVVGSKTPRYWSLSEIRNHCADAVKSLADHYHESLTIVELTEASR